jgi:hypothetical protein
VDYIKGDRKIPKIALRNCNDENLTLFHIYGGILFQTIFAISSKLNDSKSALSFLILFLNFNFLNLLLIYMQCRPYFKEQSLFQIIAAQLNTNFF